MKIINRYIFKELISPFILSLFILVFVLLTQFMIKHLDKFLGKGLSFGVIFKFIIYQSASILSLAAPMAILVATMMAFGRLSSDNEITGFKASGVNYFDFLKPSLLFGFIIVLSMIPFNLWILPDMNHNMRKLSYQVSKDRPDIEIKENMINILYEKIIYVGDRIGEKSFSNIIIFNKESIRNKTTILAEQGTFKSLSDGIILNLYNGSIHENIKSSNDEYRKTYFEKYKILIPFNKINLDKNRVLIKNDREMNLNTILSEIRLKEVEINDLNDNNYKSLIKINNLEIEKEQLNTESNIQNKKNNIRLNQIQTSINNIKNNIRKNDKIIPLFKNDLNKYKVELHKRFSIPIACIIFILLGIPLGIVSKKGNFSISIAISLGFFIIYWALLTIGEFLGDEGTLHPALSMWIGNIFIGILSIYLLYISSNENFTINNKLISIKKILKKWGNK
ncbi:MAG: hypothetical protein CMG66_05660 [Candidatus Marinimicrobia bacterium]|nr:hypothetical protein [Candidatus Neomarinimicrobiota bacterium]